MGLKVSLQGCFSAVSSDTRRESERPS
jgi:hypothetical protein